MANTISSADLYEKNPYPVGLKYNLLTGDAADTDIAVSGLVTTDKIVYCLQWLLSSTAADINVVDLTSEVVILTDGNIQLTDTDTTGCKLFLCWWDKA